LNLLNYRLIFFYSYRHLVDGWVVAGPDYYWFCSSELIQSCHQEKLINISMLYPLEYIVQCTVYSGI
jgi:hypothetical protein